MKFSGGTRPGLSLWGGYAMHRSCARSDSPDGRHAVGVEPFASPCWPDDQGVEHRRDDGMASVDAPRPPRGPEGCLGGWEVEQDAGPGPLGEGAAGRLDPRLDHL